METTIVLSPQPLHSSTHPCIYTYVNLYALYMTLLKPVSSDLVVQGLGIFARREATVGHRMPNTIKVSA